MGDFLGLAAGGASIGQAGTDLYNARKQRKLASTAMAEQKKAQDQALANAQATARKADEAYRREHAKVPDIAALLLAEQANAGKGIGGTMLTGPGGVNRDKMKLGGASLLGE